MQDHHAGAGATERSGTAHESDGAGSTSAVSSSRITK